MPLCSDWMHDSIPNTVILKNYFISAILNITFVLVFLIGNIQVLTNSNIVDIFLSPWAPISICT